MPSSAHADHDATACPRLGGPAGVLPPHVPAVGAPVPADRDHQRRGAPAQRLVRQPTPHAVTGDALAAAATAPGIRLDDPARQHRTIRVAPLASDFQTQLLKPAERGQVRTGEGNVKHIEVFRRGSVRTPILGRPRPLPGPDAPLHPHLRRAGFRLLLVPCRAP